MSNLNYPVEFQDKDFDKYVRRLLGKKTSEPFTEAELESITSLKIDSNIMKKFNIGELVFFKGLKSLTLDGFDLGDAEIAHINKLANVQTIVIRNSTISAEKAIELKERLTNITFVECTNVNARLFNGNTNLQKLAIIASKGVNLNGVSDLENLAEVELHNNEELTDEEVEDLWNARGVKSVNLDGQSNISIRGHEGLVTSQSEFYRPTERKEWESKSTRSQSYSLEEAIAKGDLSDASITIGSHNVEYLNTPDGQELISRLRSNGNTINLMLSSTADMDKKTMEGLNEFCEFSKVYVNTGWQGTQEEGYSYDTYSQIKDKISEIVSEIDPNQSEEEIYKQAREKITATIKYDYAALDAGPKDHDYYASRNMENGLLNNTCVCAGYVDILKNVLAERGVKCRYVEGKTEKGEAHAWCQVCIKTENGERWVNDDITWDAVSGKNDFYMVDANDPEFLRTHMENKDRSESIDALSHTGDAR